MSRIARWSKIGIVYVGILLAGSGLTASRVASAEDAKSGFCAAPIYRQFDFWAGDWDVFDVGRGDRKPACAALRRATKIAIRMSYELALL